MIADIDDYKRTDWANKEQANIQIDAEEAGLDYTDKEKMYAMQRNNAVSDMWVRYNSDMADALRRAEIDDSLTQEAAVNEVNQRYLNPEEFQDTPALQRDWSNQIRSVMRDGLYRAQIEDFKTEQGKVAFNVKYAFDSVYSEIAQGTITAEDAMEKISPRVLPMLATLNPRVASQAMSEKYSEAVLREAMYYIDQYNTGGKEADPQTLTAQLRGMINKYKEREYFLTEEDDPNKVLTDSEGNPRKITLTLSPKVIDYLEAGVSMGKGQAASEGSSVSTPSEQYMSRYKEVLGLDEEYDKSGFSAKAMSYSDAQYDSVNNQVIDDLANSSLSLAKKQATYAELIKVRGELDASRSVAKLASVSKDGTGAQLLRAQEKLNNALRNGANVDWTNFTLEVDGVVLQPKIEKQAGEYFGDLGITARTYWEKFAGRIDTITKTVTEGSPDKFLSSISVDYKNAKKQVIDGITASQLIVREGNGMVRMNNSAVDQLAQKIGAVADVQKKYYRGSVPALDFGAEMITAVSNENNGFYTDTEKLTAYRGIAKAFTMKGRATDLGNFATGAKGDPMLMTALALNTAQDGADSQAKKYVSEINNRLAGTTLQALKDTYGAKAEERGISKPIMAGARAEVYKELHIPDIEQDQLNNLSDICSMVTIANNGDPDDYKKMFKSLVGGMYVRPNWGRTKCEGAVFKYSRQMQPYQGPDGTRMLEKDMELTLRNIDSLAKAYGLDRKAVQNLTFYSDNEAGVFRLKQNGVGIKPGIAGSTTSRFAGVMYRDASLKDVDPNVLAEANAEAFLLNTIANTQAGYNVARKSIDPRYRDRNNLLVSLKRLNNPDTFKTAVLQHNKKKTLGPGGGIQDMGGWYSPVPGIYQLKYINSRSKGE
jgi:hypothetical protein